MTNLKVLLAGLYACCGSLLFINFDGKQDGGGLLMPKNVGNLRASSSLGVSVRGAGDAPMVGAHITLSPMTKGGEVKTFIKETSKNGTALFSRLPAGVYQYRIVASGKSGSVRMGKVQLRPFEDQSLKVTFEVVKQEVK